MLTVLTTENTLSDASNAKYRVMSPVSFVPEEDLHFVLCDFGRSGQAYVETDPSQADARRSSAIFWRASTLGPFGSWR
jgi:hypothetical protein